MLEVTETHLAILVKQSGRVINYSDGVNPYSNARVLNAMQYYGTTPRAPSPICLIGDLMIFADCQDVPLGQHEAADRAYGLAECASCW